MASIRKRTSSSGDVKYTVQVRLKGHPPEVASFERLTNAKKWAQSTEAAIREGRYFKTAIKAVVFHPVQQHYRHLSAPPIVDNLANVLAFHSHMLSCVSRFLGIKEKDYH